MSHNCDYIIVGQGIAGTVLGLSLLNEGKSIRVIDMPELSNCSKVAAGNYNPIVFKRLVKSWKADELIPFLETFYGEAEKFLSASFHKKMDIVKLFTEAQEEKLWIKKANDQEKTYLKEDKAQDDYKNYFNYFSSGTVEKSGNIDVPVFLKKFKNYLVANNLLLEEKFDFNALSIDDPCLSYKDIVCKKILFCEGWKVHENPFFNYLPLKPAKGDILTIKAENLMVDKIIHKGIFILPKGNNHFVVGSTYNWENLNDIPSEEAKEELVTKLNELLKVPYQIIQHQSGVRPSVKDIRPIIGLHSKHKNIGIFNGLGTKGIMLAPYFAKQFVNFLERNLPIEQEVDVNRFN